MSEAVRATLIEEYKKKIDEFKAENLADIQNKVYSRELILLMREINKNFHFIPCPLSEHELKRIGIHPSQKNTSPKITHEYKKKLQDRRGRRSFKNKIPRKTIKPNPTFPSIYQEGSAEAKIEKVKKDVRCLLNKLILSNFVEISAEIINKCNWEDKFIMNAIAELVFNKAIHEPMFIKIYADLCLALHEAEKNSEKENSEFYFHRAIIRSSQQNFVATAFPYNDDKQIEDGIGILKFISSLYQNKLLNFKIIENCIAILIRNAENSDNEREVMLEYAIILMKTVGPLLIQRKEEASKLDGCISYVENHKRMVSNRIKFMIIDLMEARDKKWSDKTGNDGAFECFVPYFNQAHIGYETPGYPRMQFYSPRHEGTRFNIPKCKSKVKQISYPSRLKT
uniref:MIF4G domain-containing protein n=1 Tax=Panagrolaimus davidi TaxID=227884 RepID=A0A914P3E3_9BILA